MKTQQQEAAMPRRSYSYKRVSTSGKQVRGDGLRRQDDYAQEISSREGWILDDTLAFADKGRSGFHGANLKPTADLTRFLDLVQRGRITPGSVLIIENIDRLSRQDVDIAYDVFRGILKAGVWIATQTPPRVYKKENNSFMDLMEPIWLMYLAHMESVKKSERGLHAWQSAREKICAGQAHQNRPPGWIRRTASGYELVPDRATAVRRLFELTCQGFGASLLAHRMTEEARPTIGRSGRWDSNTIYKILRGRVVLGEFQPRRKEGTRDVPEGRPVANFYPPVVTETEWLSAQAAISGRKNKRGRPTVGFMNLFVGLVFDSESCRPLSIKSKYKKGKKYSYLRLSDSRGPSVRYEYAEVCILDTLAMLRPEDVLEPSARHDEREHRIADLTARQTALEHRQRQLQGDAADPEKDYLLPALAQVSADLKATARERESLQLETRSGRAEALTEIQTLFQLRQRAKGEEREDLDRRIKAALPSVVTRIEMRADRVSARKQVTHIAIHLRSGARRDVRLQPEGRKGT